MSSIQKVIKRTYRSRTRKSFYNSTSMDKTPIGTASLKSLRRNSLIVTKSTLRMSLGVYRKRQNEANLLSYKINDISQNQKTWSPDPFELSISFIITNLTHKLQLGRTPEIHLPLSSFCPRKKCLAYLGRWQHTYMYVRKWTPRNKSLEITVRQHLYYLRFLSIKNNHH